MCRKIGFVSLDSLLQDWRGRQRLIKRREFGKANAELIASFGFGCSRDVFYFGSRIIINRNRSKRANEQKSFGALSQPNFFSVAVNGASIANGALARHISGLRVFVAPMSQQSAKVPRCRAYTSHVHKMQPAINVGDFVFGRVILEKYARDGKTTQ